MGMANRIQVVAARRERARRLASQQADLAPVPAATARRNARIGIAFGFLVPWSCMAVLDVLVRVLHFAGGWLVPAAVLGLVPLFMPAALLWGNRLPQSRGQNPNLLTFRTYTGRRTVDLAGLVRVRRLIVPNRGGPGFDGLVLTDRHGVRVVVRDRETIAAVSRLVDRQRSDRAGSVGPSKRPQISVTRAAAARMGLEAGPWWKRTGAAVLAGLGALAVVCAVIVGEFVLVFGTSYN